MRMRALAVVLPVALVLSLGAVRWAASGGHDFTGFKVRLQTADIEATVAFYHGLLGLEIVDRWSEGDDSGVIFGLSDATGTAFLEFGRVESPNNGAASVQLRVEDMDGFLRGLGDAWAVDGPHERPWGSVYSYLRDPNGVQVIVFDGRV
ncbi:MAG: VOC family protein [Gemmatimonadetes bacterium]|nr:MAG: VOC family protein [Gemmatimonadota bacterium]